MNEMLDFVKAMSDPVRLQIVGLLSQGSATREEIAARLNEPLGTVHTRARLALQRLRQILLPLHLDNVSG